MYPSIALYGLFLLLLVLLAFIAARVLSRRDASGERSAVGLLPGCALAAGLFFLGGLGLLALLSALTIQSFAGIFELVPDVRRVYIGTEPERAFDDYRPYDLPVPGDRSAPVDRPDPLDDLDPVDRDVDSGDDSSASLPYFSDPDRPLHLVFELPGHGAAPAGMVPWFREWFDEDVKVHNLNRTDDEGNETTLIDVALPADRHDLRELESLVRKAVPGASWAEGLRIEFKGAQREW